MQKYETLFDGTLGKWKCKPYHITLKDGVTPYYSKQFTVPKAFETTLKVELECLYEIGVLRKVNHSKWAFPSLIIPKKDKTIRFISNMCELIISFS